VSALQHWQHLIAASAARPVHDRGLARMSKRAGVGAGRQRTGRVTGRSAGEAAGRGGGSAIL
jgi:hypothetical protein